jgi:hypothetical protein
MAVVLSLIAGSLNGGRPTTQPTGSSYEDPGSKAIGALFGIAHSDEDLVEPVTRIVAMDRAHRDISIADLQPLVTALNRGGDRFGLSSAILTSTALDRADRAPVAQQPCGSSVERGHLCDLLLRHAFDQEAAGDARASPFARAAILLYTCGGVPLEAVSPKPIWLTPEYRRVAGLTRDQASVLRKVVNEQGERIDRFMQSIEPLEAFGKRMKDANTAFPRDDELVQAGDEFRECCRLADDYACQYYLAVQLHDLQEAAMGTHNPSAILAIRKMAVAWQLEWPHERYIVHWVAAITDASLKSGTTRSGSDTRAN